MTIALCFNCGETKFGAWCPCGKCGVDMDGTPTFMLRADIEMMPEKIVAIRTASGCLLGWPFGPKWIVQWFFLLGRGGGTGTIFFLWNHFLWHFGWCWDNFVAGQFWGFADRGLAIGWRFSGFYGWFRDSRRGDVH